jgi:tripartite motif-containing protein 2/3/tripartite motif-containing protein 71
VSRVIHTPRVDSFSNGVAVSVDGATLLLSDSKWRSSHTVHVFSLAAVRSGRRVLGGLGDGPLQLNGPRQVCIAPDGFVFVAEYGNHRVQVLTPDLAFHAFIGQGQLKGPFGVCANADVVVVSEFDMHRISVFNRADGALVRQFGCEGGGDGQLMFPHALCFISGGRRVAVADETNRRVSVFSIDGEFIRHVGAGVLRGPSGIAASAYDELVVADRVNCSLYVFSAAGDLLTSVGDRRFTGVVVRGGSVFGVDVDAGVVWVYQ